MSEIDVPNNKKILAMVIAVIITLILTVFGVSQYYDMSVRAEIDRKQNSVEDPRRAKMRAATDDCLKNYQYTDATNATVRIPVAKAEALVLADWDKRPSTLVSTVDPRLPDAVAPPAPASAPAATQPAATQPATAPTSAPATPPTPATAPTHS
jgi:hypothetical protein